MHRAPRVNLFCFTFLAQKIIFLRKFKSTFLIIFRFKFLR